MNAPDPAFTSSTIRSVPTASFFDITLAAISGSDSTVAVASRSAYSGPSAGTRSADCAATAHPIALDLRSQLVRAEIGAQARDRLELVERAARVAEPPARELRHRQAEGGAQRREHQRDAVGHTAGGVLVDGRRVEAGEVDRRRPSPPWPG